MPEGAPKSISKEISGENKRIIKFKKNELIVSESLKLIQENFCKRIQYKEKKERVILDVDQKLELRDIPLNKWLFRDFLLK